ncbi:MAG: serine/threonine protein kinase [Candidatus Hydrogenedentes bacterium]|nr:serine/threonine protein kinase [Candidatus Hydrogenedentota bacterium]
MKPEEQDGSETEARGVREDAFDDVFTGNLPTEIPDPVENDTDDWENAPTRAFSLLDSAPVPHPTDQAFLLTRSDAEPETIFDAESRANARAPREMKIAREGDGKKLPEGYVINERFEIRRCLGSGRVGTVYLVDDLRLKDKKALKLMHPALIDSEEASRRFIAEIKTLQGLSHEHIVRVYDFGLTEPGGLSFFTMEFVDGISLAQLLKKKGGRLPVDKALGLIAQVLDTLAYAHEHGTHRHLTPINVMVRATGRIALLNFGLSTTHSSSGLPVEQTHFELDYYQAPEQRENAGAVDTRTDLYAVSAILYQMLCGEVPLTDALPPSRVHPEVPRSLDRVVMRGLAEKPEDRFQSASEMKEALERAGRARKSSVLWVGLGILGLLAGAAAAWFLLG